MVIIVQYRCTEQVIIVQVYFLSQFIFSLIKLGE